MSDSPLLMGNHSGSQSSSHQSSDSSAQRYAMRFFPFLLTLIQTFTSATDPTTSGHARRDNEVELLARFVQCGSVASVLASKFDRLVADALKDSVAELRKDEETRVSQYVHTKHPRADINMTLSQDYRRFFWRNFEVFRR